MTCNHTYGLRIESLGLGGCQSYGEIAIYPCSSIELLPVANYFVTYIVFRSADPICTHLVKTEQCFEINIRLIHHVERKWFRTKAVQFVAIMPFAISNVDACRNTSTKIKQCVHLNGSFAVLPKGPCRKHNTCGYCG